MKKEFYFSAPGRTEISGNHTDHQHGCVLAGAVNLETEARVTFNGLGVIRVQSDGYPMVEVDLFDLHPRKEEVNTTAALVRGVAAVFAGTVQAFVPLDMLDSFKQNIEAVLGFGSCHVLSIRAEGGIRLS